jgi:homoserine kinase
MTIRVPATSANLGPGFDSLGLSLGLFNTVIIEHSSSHRVSIQGESSKMLKMASNSMFVDIFKKHYDELTDDMGLFSFEFINNIPLSRGLGSSSAVITSAIASAYKMANVKITKTQLLQLAIKIETHPDNIAPAIYGGFVVSAMDKGVVSSLKKNIPNTVKAVIIVPKKSISTKKSRKKLPSIYEKTDSIFNLSHSSLLTASFFSENWDMLKIASQDNFHERYRMELLPMLFDIQQVSYDYGALMCTLSGSGSTMFCLCYESDAPSLCLVLQNKFAECRVKVLDFDNKGIVSYE